MVLETITVGPMQVNCYILAQAKAGEAILIDPGQEAEKIKRRLNVLGLKVKFIVNTHGHADHIAANAAFACPVYIHRLEADFLTDPRLNLSSVFGLPISSPAANRLLEDGEELRLNTISLKVIHTPGHTPGGICLQGGGYIFTGDTLFAQGIGRTDLAGGCTEDLLNSIRNKLMVLADTVVIYPGHGPSSTIGRERKNNPFL